MTDQEKSYWRVYTAVQELLRVTDEDVERNVELKKLLHAVANVARLYRVHGADAIYEKHKTEALAERGIPTIKPKK